MCLLLFEIFLAWDGFVEGPEVIAQLRNLNHVAWLHCDRPTWEMKSKIFFNFFFTFYLNRDTSVVEFSLS